MELEVQELDTEFEDTQHDYAVSTGFLDPNAKPPVVSSVLNFISPRGAVSGKVWFRGGWTCNCVATSLPWVEYDMVRKGIIKSSIDIFQLGYNGGGVAASAGTHDAGGNIDVAQRSPAHIRVWRDWGWAMQERIGVGSGPHAHGWPIGCPHLSAGARHQWEQWKNRTNGLANYGPIQGPYTLENWRDALERNFYEMFTLGDIREAMDSTLNKNLGKIAEAVLSRDSIPNTLTGNAKNKFISLKTALDFTGRKFNATDASLDTVNSKINSLARDNDQLRATITSLQAQVETLAANSSTEGTKNV